VDDHQDTPAAEPLVRRCSAEEVVEHVLGVLQTGARNASQTWGFGKGKTCIKTYKNHPRDVVSWSFLSEKKHVKDEYFRKV
jgi:hypothetical protein